MPNVSRYRAPTVYSIAQDSDKNSLKKRTRIFSPLDLFSTVTNKVDLFKSIQPILILVTIKNRITRNKSSESTVTHNQS